MKTHSLNIHIETLTPKKHLDNILPLEFYVNMKQKALQMTSNSKLIGNLAKLYLHFNIPSDTLVTNPPLLNTFTQSLRDCGHDLTSEQVSKALINARKNRKLPRLRHN